MTGDDRVDHILAILGALVPLCSALSSWINHVVRTKNAQGADVAPWLLNTGSMLNIASVNLDKALELRKMAVGVPFRPALEPTKAVELCETCGQPKP